MYKMGYLSLIASRKNEKEKRLVHVSPQMGGKRKKEKRGL